MKPATMKSGSPDCRIPRSENEQMPSRIPGTDDQATTQTTPDFQAEIALNAILNLLERSKDNNRLSLGQSVTLPEDHFVLDHSVTVDPNAQLVSEIQVIATDFRE